MKVRYQYFKNMKSPIDAEANKVDLANNARFIHNGTEEIYRSIRKGIEEVQKKDDYTLNGFALLEGLSVVTCEVIKSMAVSVSANSKRSDKSSSYDIAQNKIEALFDNYMWTNMLKVTGKSQMKNKPRNT